MFRWSSSPTWGAIPGLLERTQLNSVFDPDAPTPPGRGFHSQLLFEGPTRHLRKLHAHMSWVEPGAGYAAHVDDYNVAIVLIQGTLETLGKTIEAPALLFHPKGSEHGLRAIGPVGAHYLVVEFHGTDEPRPEPAGILQRLVRGWRRLTIHQN